MFKYRHATKPAVQSLPKHCCRSLDTFSTSSFSSVFLSSQYFECNVLSIQFPLRVVSYAYLVFLETVLLVVKYRLLCLLHAYVTTCFILAVLYLIIIFSSNLHYSTLFYSFVPQLQSLLPSSLHHRLFLEQFFATLIYLLSSPSLLV